jgi:hypothetical protein
MSVAAETLKNIDRVIELPGSDIAECQVETRCICIGYVPARGEEMRNGLRE